MSCLSDTILGFSSHPVHIKDKDGKQSPSAFIPFCEFGGNMLYTSISYDNFHWPVCDIFNTRVLNDQLCYEADLENLKSQDNFKHDIKLGLVFFMDYNEDRQIKLQETVESPQRHNMVGSVDESHDDKKGYIYLNTIGKSF